MEILSGAADNTQSSVIIPPPLLMEMVSSYFQEFILTLRIQFKLKHEVQDNIRLGAVTSDASTRNFLGTHLQGLDFNVLQRMPQRGWLEKNVRNKRRKVNNPLREQNSINFPISEQYEDLVLFDSGEHDRFRILAFGHPEMPPYLHRDLHLGDGTFSVVPEIFFQLYTVHCQVGNNYPSCLYFFLPNKTEATYTRMVHIVPQGNPTRILFDFERVAINAFQNQFSKSSGFSLLFSPITVCHPKSC